MSKIFDLINELCPNGVEFRELQEICYTITSPIKLKANQYRKNGKIPIIDQGEEFIAGYCDCNSFINKGEYVIFGDHSEHIKFIDFAFVQGADGLKILVAKECILPKFLYYSFLNFYCRENNYKRHWSRAKETKLPVPPMEVQREIVRILDSFTLLTAELTARKKQYEFYRDFLLSFDELDKNGGGCELKMLGEMILNVSNIKWSNNDKIYNYIDLTSVDMQNHQIGNLSNISKEKHPSRAQQIVKFNDIIFATTRPMQKRIAMIPKYLDGQICSTGYCVLRVDEKIALSSWVYYVLCTSIFYDYVDKFQQGASYPSISDNIVKKFKIPVPSLQTQQKVVEILDKFDTLVNSITEGLPREIELRRKQYEHYRELLLNFKPKMTA
ncbi:restriction endonuclease subunit S [Campylobacter concisus]|uniref:restriction endonuclease subunit S n=3 Tax=Campylobacter concisus TaxID=199 RepID=UPI000CD8437C|nr:restriction endonuclease subunit S [Campylobacter concisus]